MIPGDCGRRKASESAFVRSRPIAQSQPARKGKEADMKQAISAGMKVRLIAPMAVPVWCEFDDDRGRVSNHVKQIIRDRFFKADPKLTAEILHISKEGEREKLRKAGRTKVRVRMPSGDTIVITAEVDKLTRA